MANLTDREEMKKYLRIIESGLSQGDASSKLAISIVFREVHLLWMELDRLRKDKE